MKVWYECGYESVAFLPPAYTQLRIRTYYIADL
jgi:hypothetical protein